MTSAAAEEKRLENYLLNCNYIQRSIFRENVFCVFLFRIDVGGFFLQLRAVIFDPPKCIKLSD